MHPKPPYDMANIQIYFLKYLGLFAFLVCFANEHNSVLFRALSRCKTIKHGNFELFNKPSHFFDARVSLKQNIFDLL